MPAGLKLWLLLCILAIALGTPGCRREQPYPQVSGPYCGEEPPGMTPKLFAPALFREEVHSVPAFSPDGDEVYWGPMSDGALLHMRLVDGTWTAPSAPAFSQAHDDSPVFTPDGSKIYFVAWRSGPEDIWFVERTAVGWSNPVALPQTVNSLMIHWQISLAENGDLYFGAQVTENDDQDIYVARLVDGQYATAERLGAPVNTENLYEHSPYIAPDGSHLLFSRVNVQLTDADLYVCFRNADGSWGEALRFPAPINTGRHDQCPRVSHDGKYLFFASFRGGSSQVYWVDARVIEDMRPQ
jgi:hypothetical protein